MRTVSARAERFRDALKNYPEIVFQTTPEGQDNVHYCFPARLKGGIRDAFMERMAFHHQVKMVVQYYPLNRYPMFRKAGFGEANCPNTDAFFDNMVSFPFHEWMPEEQFTYMIDATKETLDSLRG